MSENIKCPKCGALIPLTEAVAGEALESQRKKLEREFDDRTLAIQLREKDLENRKSDMEMLIRARVETESQRLAKNEIDNAKQAAQHLQKILDENNRKLAEAQTAQSVAMAQQRLAEEKMRELDLEVERRTTANLNQLRTQAQREADERYSLTVAERDRTIQKMRDDLDEARRRADQGSQKDQGEVLELNFEAALRSEFPTDEITAVADRAGAGDLSHTVMHNGIARGVIIWELKRTKNWADDWLPKLRNIKRAKQADIAILCSQALPEEVTTFERIDGVWVCSPAVAIPLAMAIRHGLIELDQATRKTEGQETKAELVYSYLTGQLFKNRIEAIVERFSEMRDDLDKEQKFFSKQWAKREEQLKRVIGSTVGLYGDLQGIAGSAIAELPAINGE